MAVGGGVAHASVGYMEGVHVENVGLCVLIEI